MLEIDVVDKLVSLLLNLLLHLFLLFEVLIFLSSVPALFAVLLRLLSGFFSFLHCLIGLLASSLLITTLLVIRLLTFSARIFRAGRPGLSNFLRLAINFRLFGILFLVSALMTFLLFASLCTSSASTSDGRGRLLALFFRPRRFLFLLPLFRGLWSAIALAALLRALISRCERFKHLLVRFSDVLLNLLAYGPELTSFEVHVHAFNSFLRSLLLGLFPSVALLFGLLGGSSGHDILVLGRRARLS